LARVADVILRHFGVRYHPSQVWRILLALDWSPQKPQRLARERDEVAIARWRRVDWPRIKKTPRKPAEAGARFSRLPDFADRAPI
jgi:hypothetical protein